MQRITIVGTSGVGKSTLARDLSARLGIPHIELDSLYWQADWTPTEDVTFIAVAKQRIADTGTCWIIDGNYSMIQAYVLEQADTLVWLDYPLAVILWRMLRRTVRRVFGREQLWNGNVETFHKQFLTGDSLFIWVLQTYKKRKQTYRTLMASNQYPHLTFVHLQSPRQTEEWLGTL